LGTFNRFTRAYSWQARRIHLLREKISLDEHSGHNNYGKGDRDLRP
jgi:hypothetical protein